MQATKRRRARRIRPGALQLQCRASRVPSGCGITSPKPRNGGGIARPRRLREGTTGGFSADSSRSRDERLVGLPTRRTEDDPRLGRAMILAIADDIPKELVSSSSVRTEVVCMMHKWFRSRAVLRDVITRAAPASTPRRPGSEGPRSRRAPALVVHVRGRSKRRRTGRTTISIEARKIAWSTRRVPRENRVPQSPIASFTCSHERARHDECFDRPP